MKSLNLNLSKLFRNTASFDNFYQSKIQKLDEIKKLMRHKRQNHKSDQFVYLIKISEFATLVGSLNIKSLEGNNAEDLFDTMPSMMFSESKISWSLLFNALFSPFNNRSKEYIKDRNEHAKFKKNAFRILNSTSSSNEGLDTYLNLISIIHKSI